MNWFKRQIINIVTKSIETFKLTGSSVGFFRFGSGFVFNRELNRQEALQQGFGSNPFIYSVIDYIADIISTLPRSVIDSSSKKEIENSEIMELLENPNPLDTKESFYYKICAYLDATGEAFILGTPPFGFDSGKFAEIEVLHTPDVLINEDALYRPISYSYNGVTYGIDEILHIKHENILRRTSYGLPPINASREVNKATVNNFTAEASIYENRGGVTILSNETERPILPKEQNDLQNSFKDQFAGPKKAGQMMLLPGKIKPHQVGLPPSELELFKSAVQKLRWACNIFKIPSVIFNDPENSSFNNLREAIKRAYRDSILPKSKMIDMKLSKWLTEAGLDNENVKIKVRKSELEVLKEDEKEKSERIRAEVQDGILTPEEGRELLYPNGLI